MDPSLWGPSYWFVLHSIAFNYPKNPTPLQRKIHYRFIQHLPEMMPNPMVSTYFTKLIHKYPVEPYLDTKKDFIKWMHFIHNEVNLKLEKPTISLTDHYNQMNDAYTPKLSRLQQLMKEKYKVAISIFILLCLAMIYYLMRHTDGFHSSA